MNRRTFVVSIPTTLYILYKIFFKDPQEGSNSPKQDKNLQEEGGKK